MFNKERIVINLPYPWMSKAFAELQEAGFLTTQESIDAALKDAVRDVLEKYQNLAELRKRVFDSSIFESWEEQKAAAMRDIPIHVRDIKSALVRGSEVYEGLWQLISHNKHRFMTYQEWIDYHMEHWSDWKHPGVRTSYYGWTEEKMKQHWPEAEFNKERMMPCTCKMCKDGASYLF